ncbi:hypothetical protein DFH06DRAFT_566318 [Mycena polygramma]|nr:hypothetical protein DFH06DRAFT_566318 [Mycena polygramma]
MTDRHQHKKKIFAHRSWPPSSLSLHWHPPIVTFPRGLCISSIANELSFHRHATRTGTYCDRHRQFPPSRRCSRYLALPIPTGFHLVYLGRYFTAQWPTFSTMVDYHMRRGREQPWRYMVLGGRGRTIHQKIHSFTSISPVAGGVLERRLSCPRNTPAVPVDHTAKSIGSSPSSNSADLHGMAYPRRPRQVGQDITARGMGMCHRRTDLRLGEIDESSTG